MFTNCIVTVVAVPELNIAEISFHVVLRPIFFTGIIESGVPVAVVPEYNLNSASIGILPLLPVFAQVTNAEKFIYVLAHIPLIVHSYNTSGVAFVPSAQLYINIPPLVSPLVWSSVSRYQRSELL